MSKFDSLPENDSFTRYIHVTEEEPNFISWHFLKWRELFRPQVNFEGFMQQKLYKLYDFISAIEARCQSWIE